MVVEGVGFVFLDGVGVYCGFGIYVWIFVWS